jgi:predicted phosphoribosyltransferase
MRFRDRREAGDLLARALLSYGDQPGVLVLGIPRGGVPVAARVAEALRAPLDILIVRKLGLPGYEELAMGAIASVGPPVLNRDVIDEFGVDEATINRVAAHERLEVQRREREYRGDRPPVDVEGRTVILVDDGLATGSTMHAAVTTLRPRHPASVVVAVPVAPPSACGELEPVVDRLVCLVQPHAFLAVGAWYEDFTPTSDEEVRALLSQAPPAAHPSPR